MAGRTVSVPWCPVPSTTRVSANANQLRTLIMSLIINVIIIYSSEATTTSQLKISCLNQYRGSCAGKTEVYMLCDKVQKGNLHLR